MGARTKQLLILPRRIGEGIAEEVALRWAMGEAKFIRRREREPEKGESGGLNERTQSKARRQQLKGQLRLLLSSHRPGTIFMWTFLGWLEKPAHSFLPHTATCVPQRRSHILLISMPPTTSHDPWHASRCPVKELDPGARPARLLWLRQEDSQVQDVCGFQWVQSQPKQVTENLSRKQSKRSLRIQLSGRGLPPRAPAWDAILSTTWTETRRQQSGQCWGGKSD